jgi:hypothetical protein
LSAALNTQEVCIVDSDGYGERPNQPPAERLIEDCRTIGPSGIERVAAAWDRRAPDLYAAAEHAALHVVETTNRGGAWDDLRNRLLGLTEHGTPLLAWRAEHGDVGHKAEDALLGAALALVAQPDLDRRHSEALLRPMAAALPWLLSASIPS